MHDILPCMYDFPDADQADPDGQGLICIGGDLNPATLLSAYQQGLFPWFNEGDPICWWSPDPRCVIYPEQYHPSKTLIRSMKKYDYQVTINRAFEQVGRDCVLPLNYPNDIWCSAEYVQGHAELFKAG